MTTADRVASQAPELAIHAPLLRALSDETRLRLLARLAVAESDVCVCDLTVGLDLSQPTLSHHLRVLRDAHVVRWERRGSWVYYRLDPTALGALADLLAGLLPRKRIAETADAGARLSSCASSLPAETAILSGAPPTESGWSGKRDLSTTQARVLA